MATKGNKKKRQRRQRITSRQPDRVRTQSNDDRHLQRIQKEWEFLSPILDACREDEGGIDWSQVNGVVRNDTAAIEQGLISSMAPYDAFDIVANVLFANLPFDPETYTESEHEGLLALVEFAASRCLRRPGRVGTGDREDPSLGGHVGAWNEQMRRLLRLRALGQMAALADDDSKLVRMRYHQFQREMLLRNVAYDWQAEQASPLEGP